MLQTTGIGNVKAGLCPHGLPFGACPICSGMMGGGAMRKADFSAKPGEMSWAECAAIGAFLKAQQMRAQQAKNQLQTPLVAIVTFQNNVQSVINKLANFVQSAQNSPSLLSKPLALVAGKLLIPMLNAFKNLPLALVQKFADISDKLAAVYGEIKNAIAKKVSDTFKNIKKKIKSLFSIFETTDADDEDKKIDEEKRAFELKTFFKKIYKRISKEHKGEKE